MSFLQGYYKRTPHYVPIRNWKRTGCHPVPMIHSTMLIDLRRSASTALAFYPVHHFYLWALDDIMAFAFSARQAGNNSIIPYDNTFTIFYCTLGLIKEEPIYLSLLEDVSRRTFDHNLARMFTNLPF